MSAVASRIKLFQILPQAVAFIVECLEAGSPAHLFDQTLEAESLTDPARYARRAKEFAQLEYLELLREHTRLDLRRRFGGQSFPPHGQRLTIGGDHRAGENSQIDFKKRDNAWVIERISMCR